MATCAAASGDWTAPTHALWAPFSNCVEILVKDWDVLRSAVDGGWGDGNPKQNEAKLLDDLCANFADAWIANKSLEDIEVTNFFVGTMDDVFDCDIDNGVVMPLSRLLVTLYDEAKRGVDTGISTVQARFDAKSTQAASNKAAATAMSTVASVVDDGDTNMEGVYDSSTGGPAATTAAVDDDGWETVPVRRGRGAKNR